MSELDQYSPEHRDLMVEAGIICAKCGTRMYRRKIAARGWKEARLCADCYALGYRFNPQTGAVELSAPPSNDPKTRKHIIAEALGYLKAGEDVYASDALRRVHRVAAQNKGMSRQAAQVWDYLSRLSDARRDTLANFITNVFTHSVNVERRENVVIEALTLLANPPAGVHGAYDALSVLLRDTPPGNPVHDYLQALNTDEWNRLAIEINSYWEG